MKLASLFCCVYGVVLSLFIIPTHRDNSVNSFLYNLPSPPPLSLFLLRLNSPSIPLSPANKPFISCCAVCRFPSEFQVEELSSLLFIVCRIGIGEETTVAAFLGEKQHAVVSESFY
uniref:Uncharacterized protein n=1 Tax=Salix viminalis TaxID=40686 RepID=A0A6N2MHC9_SALVM